MENIEIKKVDENTIEVVKVVPVAFNFTPEYLKLQREQILKQKEEDNAKRDKEIEEIDNYLLEMDKLGVKEKIIENTEDITAEKSSEEVIA